MVHRCDACQKPESRKLHLLSLSRAGHEAPEGEVRLCSNCVAIRQVGAWRAKDPASVRIVQALRTHEKAHDGHYQWMLDAQRDVHLLRLREDWLESKQAMHA